LNLRASLPFFVIVVVGNIYWYSSLLRTWRSAMELVRYVPFQIEIDASEAVPCGNVIAVCIHNVSAARISDMKCVLINRKELFQQSSCFK